METSVEKVTINSFDKIKERFIQLTDEETFLKEASFAMQHMTKNPAIAKCSHASIQMAVLNISQIGITLNPALKLAYLIPRRGECILEISYMGLSKLVTDTGSATNIYAHCVYENDDFSHSLGTNPEVIHKPTLKSRGNIIAVYCVAVLHNGGKQVEVMTTEDVEAIRDESESYKAFKNGKITDCIWVSDRQEMFRKTVIKRAVKYLPKTDQYERLAKAIELLDEDWAVSYEQCSLIETLLHQATISEERKEQIYRGMNLLTRSKASNLIEELKQKQVDPINSLGYNQTDIKNKLEQHT